MKRKKLISVIYPNNFLDWLGIIVLAFVSLSLSSCYQAQSEDDLRTVPTTNNPYMIPEGSRGSPLPKAGF